jgi:predicted DNA-binding antitoxin AbrB/MazE fold protein
MTTTTIHAVFAEGVFKPIEYPDLPEGATVELRIMSHTTQPAGPNAFGKLAGKLSYLSDQIVDDIERELIVLRQRSAEKLARLTAS